MAQARTKCMHDRNRAQLVHAIALTVHDKLRTLVQFFKKICFDSCKVLLLTYLSLTHTHTKKKILKIYPNSLLSSHCRFPLSQIFQQ